MNVCQRDRINYLQFPLRFENKPLKYHPFVDVTADADADVWELLALQLIGRFCVSIFVAQRRYLFLAMEEKNSYPVLLSADNAGWHINNNR